jgi:hypothetical protein
MRLARSSEDVLQQTLRNGAHHLTRRVVKIQDALDMTALHGRDPDSSAARGN